MATSEARRRLAWFAGLYVAGVGSMAAVVYGLHWLVAAIAG